MIDLVEAALAQRWDDVKQFLLENSHLTVYEIAIKVHRSASTIRSWRRKTGLSEDYPFKEQPRTRKTTHSTIADQDVWDNEEWFDKQYNTNKLGITIIAQIIGRSPRLVSLRLQRYGIETRTHAQAVRSINPCSSEEWMMYHYATRTEYIAWATRTGAAIDPGGGNSWSLKRCSEVAGVVPATIYNWLVRLSNEGGQVNIRDLNEAVAGKRNPFFGRKHTEETKKYLRKIFIERYGHPKPRTKASNQETGTD